MRPTLQLIKERFDTFNGTYFGGELPEPQFALSNARTVLGQFCCRQTLTGLFRKRRLSGCTIKVSRYYDMPERECMNILLHEMIHYYIAYRGIRDTSAHGLAFHKLMNRLNNRFGWNIRVSTDTRQWASAEPRKVQHRLVLALTTTDGKYFLSVVNRKYYSKIDSEAATCKRIATHRWIETEDEFFNSFPATRTLRGRRVTHAMFEKVVNGTTANGSPI